MATTINGQSSGLCHLPSDLFRGLLGGARSVHIYFSGDCHGHHHVGHIGILGVDKKGEEWYQITLGGSAAEDARLGKRIGPAFAKNDVVGAVERIIEVYVEHRQDGEVFLETLDRVGVEPFTQRAYNQAQEAA